MNTDKTPAHHVVKRNGHVLYEGEDFAKADAAWTIAERRWNDTGGTAQWLRDGVVYCELES